MTTINIIAIYLLCGVFFSAGFEYLMKSTDYPDRKDTTNFKRIFWITTWPYCIIKFFVGYYGNNKN
jgi:hypothetical protein|tara:strand:+ start:374 stop:571 length:198 start_codon:yes stop_codon:yes gene_type:complete